jgi:hypothetical protein
MTRGAWNKFVRAKERYRQAVKELRCGLPTLHGIQQKLIDLRSAPYAVETPIVYNAALDDVTSADDIRLILVADNPGKREQAAENRRYLVGPSGKIAERFFREKPALKIDFRKNTIILNKTPVHTPRTAELRELYRMGGSAFAKIIDQSQRTMARLLLEFHQALAPVPVWIIGYSEMKKRGIFEAYTEELRSIYAKNKLKEQLLLFRHFSMNQFTIDLNRQMAKKETLDETLERIGSAYRLRLIGW